MRDGQHVQRSLRSLWMVRVGWTITAIRMPHFSIGSHLLGDAWRTRSPWVCATRAMLHVLCVPGCVIHAGSIYSEYHLFPQVRVGRAQTGPSLYHFINHTVQDRTGLQQHFGPTTGCIDVTVCLLQDLTYEVAPRTFGGRGATSCRLPKTSLCVPRIAVMSGGIGVGIGMTGPIVMECSLAS